MKSVLITGGNGFIGSNLAKFLVFRGFEVVIVDNKPGPYIKANQISGDILNEKFLQTIENKYDVIFHCAGSASVPDSVNNPMYDFEINVLGTLNMLEFARRTMSKTFVFLSSVSVFDIENEMPLTESSVIKPTSPYGAAKASAENYCMAYYRTFGLDTRIARIFNTYGPGLRRLFVFDMINKILNAKEEIFMHGSGKQIRDYVYIDDLVEAFFLIWKNGKPGEDYNVCSGEPIKLMNIILEIRKVLGKENIKIDVEGIKQKGDIEKWYGNPQKLNKLSFNPTITISEGLTKTILSLT